MFIESLPHFCMAFDVSHLITLTSALNYSVSPECRKRLQYPCFNVNEHMVLQGKGLLPMETVLVATVFYLYVYCITNFFLTNTEHTIQMVQLCRFLLTSCCYKLRLITMTKIS